MEKRRRILTGLALSLALCCSGTAWGQNGAGAGEVLNRQEERVEQVYINMPEVYVSIPGLTPEQVREREGFLSQQELELVDAVPFSESGEGISYYVLLDISGSMPNRYFTSVKEGIMNLQSWLGPQDRLVLCAFGEEVFLAADGSQTDEQMEEILKGLNNKDQRTLLFEGIDRVATLAEQDSCRRRVLFVVSDGEDIAVGKAGAQEALNTLREKGLPAYAFCIRDTATVNINTFGEFARTSGGELIPFQPQEGPQVLCDVAEGMQDDTWARYEASSNRVSNKEETFSLRSDNAVLTRPVFNGRWIPDHQSPRLLGANAIGDNQIRLTFDEGLLGVDTASNYHLTYGEEEIGITGVAYDSKNGSVVNLSLDRPVVNGAYTVNFYNITDDSMEENPLAGPVDIEITDAPDRPGPPVREEEKPPELFDYTGILFLIFLAILALIILLLVLKNRKKSGEEKEEDGSLDGGNVVVAGGGDFRQHIAVPEPQKTLLEVWVSKNGAASQKTTWYLGSSLIVGRSSICDIQIDDPEMSRQHFCLESDQGDIYLTDLNSTNGTSLNGIRIHEKRRIAPGSAISAGAMKFTIRW